MFCIKNFVNLFCSKCIQSTYTLIYVIQTISRVVHFNRPNIRFLRYIFFASKMKIELHNEQQDKFYKNSFLRFLQNKDNCKSMNIYSQACAGKINASN